VYDEKKFDMCLSTTIFMKKFLLENGFKGIYQKYYGIVCPREYIPTSFQAFLIFF